MSLLSIWLEIITKYKKKHFLRRKIEYVQQINSFFFVAQSLLSLKNIRKGFFVPSETFLMFLTPFPPLYCFIATQEIAPSRFSTPFLLSLILLQKSFSYLNLEQTPLIAAHLSTPIVDRSRQAIYLRWGFVKIQISFLPIYRRQIKRMQGSYLSTIDSFVQQIGTIYDRKCTLSIADSSIVDR